MARVKLKEKESSKLIGQAIFKAWDAAIEKNPRAPVIDREALIKDLNGLFATEDMSYNKKRIEIDIVFDTDLDENTRLVWLSIPTPDVGGPGLETWQKWKEDYYDNKSPSEKQEKEEELGKAVLFGCGR
jgi:hypothetical protein